MRDVARSLACALGALVILAAPAAAQQAAPGSVDPSPQPSGQSTPVAPGTLTVERVPSGWVISPDVTMTEFNKEFGTLIGAYGGWLSDRTWLLGMGGYWLANNTHDQGMAYGGLVLQAMAHSDQRIGFAVKGLVGGGEAEVTAPYRDVYGTQVPSSPDILFGHGNRPVRPSHPPPITPNTQLVFHEGFFIAEPQAQLMWNVSSNVRLTFGAGYRIIAGADPVNDRLRGPIGSVSVEFGGGH
jgi:hypothetical protein